MKTKHIFVVSCLLFLSCLAWVGTGRAGEIHDQARLGDIAVRNIEALLRTNPGLVNAKDNDGQTPLFSAVRSGRKNVVQLLLSRGAEVNARANDGTTPLMEATSVGSKDIVALLLSKGAEVNAKNTYGETPLYTARNPLYTATNKDVAELLLAKGADVNARTSDGKTPLFNAAGSGSKDFVQLLLSKGADVFARTNDGQTLLFSAAGSDSKDVVELLLSKGADVNAKDQHGFTPLFNAASRGRRDVVELLLSKGAEINAKNKGGRTPLFDAVGSGSRDVVELLLTRGADVTANDWEGRTPLQVAEKDGRTDIAELLRHPETNATDAALNEGIEAARQQQWAVAIRHFLKAQDLTPTAREVLFNLGLAESKVPGRELRAMAWLQAYLLASPYAANAAAVRTEIASLKIRVEGAIEKLVAQAKQQASQFRDDYEKKGHYEKKMAFRDLAIAQARTGDTDGADQTLRKVGIDGLAQAEKDADYSMHYHNYKTRPPLPTTAEDRLDELLRLVKENMKEELFTDPQSALQTIATKPKSQDILAGTICAIEQLADRLHDLKALGPSATPATEEKQ